VKVNSRIKKIIPVKIDSSIKDKKIKNENQNEIEFDPHEIKMITLKEE
jgi:hypothetical protein